MVVLHKFVPDILSQEDFPTGDRRPRNYFVTGFHDSLDVTLGLLGACTLLRNLLFEHLDSCPILWDLLEGFEFLMCHMNSNVKKEARPEGRAS
jgi:hypothetical protein